MTHQMTPRSRGARATAALLAVCTAILALVLSPLATGTAHAEDAGTAVTIQSTSMPGQYVQEANDYVLNWDSPATWEFDFNEDGTFHIKLGDDGRCINKWEYYPAGHGDDLDPYKTNYMLEMQDCHEKNAQDPTTDSQNWYLVPVNEGGAGDVYYIVNANDRRCMDDSMTGGEVRGEKYVADFGMGECAVRSNQQFTLGNVAQRSDFTDHLHQKALSAAFKLCDAAPDSCSYEAKSYGAPRPVQEECVSTPFHNTSQNPVTAQYGRARNDGWQRSVGTTVTVGVEFGVDAGVTNKVTSSIATSYQNTWTHWDNISESWSYVVSPGRYGWVVRVIEERDVTGTWTFSIGPLQWSAEGTSTVTYPESYENRDEQAQPPSGSCHPLT